MAVFDAFSGFIKESVTGAIEDAITRLVERGMIQQPPRALQYARDSSDRMYVSVSNTPQALVYRENNPTGIATTAVNGPNALFMVDEREQMRLQSEQNNRMIRQRWSIT
jgi:hypothetical protein